ncbi:MAG: NTE family protein [Polaribacter sp.]|jgi:NTE family protein
MRFLVCFLVCGMFSINWAHANPKPKIGLVLAGGGAAGIAHVGVIRELERLGIRPDCVVGTSMGATIAGLYAAGFSADELEALILGVDWTTILNDQSDLSTRHPMRRDSRVDPFTVTSQLPIGRDSKGIQFVGGLVDGEKLSLLLRELTSRAKFKDKGVASFDDLPIPFRAIATDLQTGDQVIMRSGDLALALRASMSIPTLFPAVERNGKILVDGGVVNNFPTDVARDLCADIIIGVNLPSHEPDRRSLRTVTGTVSQLIALMVDRQVKTNIATLGDRDILITPSVSHVGILDFANASAAAELGAQAVLAVKDKLIAMGLADPNLVNASPSNALARQHGQDQLIRFDSISIDNKTSLSDQIIGSRLALSEPGEVSSSALQRQLLNIYGLGLFGSVTYRLDQIGDVSTLVISATKLRAGKYEFRAGLGLEDSFQGDGDFSLSVGAGATQLNELAGRLDLDFGIGSQLGSRLKYEQPLNVHQSQFLVSSLSFLKSTVPIYTNNDERVADFSASEGLADVSFIWAPYQSFRTGVGVSYRWNRVELRTGSRDLLTEAGLDEDWDSGVRLGLLFDYDSLDNADLPHYGSQFAFRVDVDVDAENSADRVGEVLVDGLTVKTYGKYSVAGFLSLEGELDPDGLDPHFIGGFQRLSGFSENELFGNIVLVVGARAYRNISFDNLFGNEAFVGASLEYGGVWNDWRDINQAEAVLHGSVFSGAETPFGPLILGIGFGENNEWAARFSLGSRF